MVDKVHVHVREMLEVGAICPSQSPWCNVVVLVHEKYGGLHFCIDFCKLNARTKKDSYPLPQIHETIESLVGAGCFFCLDLKTGLWQITKDEALKLTPTGTDKLAHECTPLRPTGFHFLAIHTGNYHTFSSDG